MRIDELIEQTVTTIQKSKNARVHVPRGTVLDLGDRFPDKQFQGKFLEKLQGLNLEDCICKSILYHKKSLPNLDLKTIEKLDEIISKMRLAKKYGVKTASTLDDL